MTSQKKVYPVYPVCPVKRKRLVIARSEVTKQSKISQSWIATPREARLAMTFFYVFTSSTSSLTHFRTHALLSLLRNG
jgi:hypothetical protein